MPQPIAIRLFAAFLAFLAPMAIPGQTPLPSPGPATVASSISPPGESLARKYCQTCHLFPEPGLLTRESWRVYVLPKMQAYLGLAGDQLEKSPKESFVYLENLGNMHFVASTFPMCISREGGSRWTPGISMVMAIWTS